MKILVTGAKGFVGKNLCVALKTKGHTVYEYDIESTADELKEYCKDCEFVFHLAGVNRPKDPKEFLEGNCAAADNLLATLKEKSNKTSYNAKLLANAYENKVIIAFGYITDLSKLTLKKTLSKPTAVCKGYSSSPLLPVRALQVVL